MRVIIAPVALAAALALTPVAFAAAHKSTGAVRAFDMKAHTLTLSNGTVYYLPAHFKDPGLQVGKKVSVSWTKKGGKYDASRVMLLK